MSNQILATFKLKIMIIFMENAWIPISHKLNVISSAKNPPWLCGFTTAAVKSNQFLISKIKL